MTQDFHGVDRHGLGAEFEAEEARKSNLLLQARLLGMQQQPDAAAACFAQAAEIEVRLGAVCQEQGLPAKALVHRYSALSCWAQAGNFYEALLLADELLSEAHLPVSLRQRVQDFATVLRQRRQQWFAGLEAALVGSDQL